jgi:hypothetical protein
MQNNHPTSKLPSIETQDLSQMLAENRIIDWISNNRKTLLYAFLAGLAFIFFIYRLTGGNWSQSERDYLNAANDLTLFQNYSAAQDVEASHEALGRLTAIIKRYPELHAQYDGLIAQTLINSNKRNEAAPWAIMNLNRISKDHLPYYTAYATNTLIIGEKKYLEALQQALDLKQKMLTAYSSDQSASYQSEFGDILFAFNLLRIGMLQQQAGFTEDELQTWQEWEQYAASQNQMLSAAFQTLNEQLAQGNLSLDDYVKYRKSILRNNLN